MVSFDVSCALKVTASVFLLVALPSASFSQRATQESIIEALHERIRGVEAREGPNSAGLIAPLTELGIRYQEDGSTILRPRPLNGHWRSSASITVYTRSNKRR